MIKIKAVLVYARELISNKDNWSKGMLATTSDGRATKPKNQNAEIFCAVGAIERALFDLYPTSVSAQPHYGYFISLVAKPVAESIAEDYPIVIAALNDHMFTSIVVTYNDWSAKTIFGIDLPDLFDKSGPTTHEDILFHLDRAISRVDDEITTDHFELQLWGYNSPSNHVLPLITDITGPNKELQGQ